MQVSTDKSTPASNSNQADIQRSCRAYTLNISRPRIIEIECRRVRIDLSWIHVFKETQRSFLLFYKSHSKKQKNTDSNNVDCHYSREWFYPRSYHLLMVYVPASVFVSAVELPRYSLHGPCESRSSEY